MKNKPTSILILFLTAIIWGFAFVAQVSGGAALGTFYYNGIRFTLGAVSLIPVILIFERGETGKSKITTLAGIAAGVILFIAANLQQWGVNITGSSGESRLFNGSVYRDRTDFFGGILEKAHQPQHVVRRGVGTHRFVSHSFGQYVLGRYAVLFSHASHRLRRQDLRRHTDGRLWRCGASVCAVMFAVHIVFIDYFNSSKCRP